MPGPNRVDRLADAVREAVRRNGIGDFAGAAGVVRDALTDAAAAPDPERSFWTSRLLITWAYSTFELDGEKAAMSRLAEARRLADAIGSARLRALSYVQESNLWARAMAWDAAIRAGEAAEPLADELEAEERFALHLNRGLAHLTVLHFDLAERDLAAARDLAESIHADALRYKAVHNQGCLEYVKGDLPRALALMREAEELPDDVARDRNRLDQAQVLLEAGLVDRARSLLVETLAGAERAGHRIEQGAIQLDLARCAILLGDVEGARSHAEAARAAFESLGARERSRRALLVSAEVALAAGAAATTIAAMLDEWPSTGGTLPDDRTATRLHAELLLRQGRVPESLAALDALGAPPTQGIAAEMHEAYLRAAAAAAVGDSRRSGQVCRRASGRFARHQSQLQSLEVRASLALHVRRLAEFDVAQSLTEGRPADVFTSVERWRAGPQAVPTVRPSEDETAAHLMSQLRAAQRERALGGAGVSELDSRIAELTRRVERREWETARDASASSGEPVTPQEALTHLDDRDTGLISLFTSQGLLYALVLDERLRLCRVGEVDDVLRAVALLRLDLRARGLSRHVPALGRTLDAAVRDSAGRLSTLLFGPRSLLPVPDRKRVVIVPGRSLASVPWHLLEAVSGRAIVVAQSVTRWARMSTLDSYARPRVAVAVGPGLAEAEREADEVLAAWAGLAHDVSRSRLATSREVVDALDSATVVHLAAHGTHEDENPMFSTLRMADGPVFLHEMPRPCRAEHVVLSSCDVGQSKVGAGDEALGLTAGLLALGARSVVSSVAPVDDEATHEAMVQYHRCVAGGATAAEALARVAAESPAARTFSVHGVDWAASRA